VKRRKGEHKKGENRLNFERRQAHEDREESLLLSKGRGGAMEIRERGENGYIKGEANHTAACLATGEKCMESEGESLMKKRGFRGGNEELEGPTRGGWV